MVRNTSGLKRGGTGRKKGTPNRVTVEVREAATALVDDPIYRANLLKRLRAGRLHSAMETLLWHYAKGKPKERFEVTGPLGGPIEVTAVRESLARRVTSLAEQLAPRRLVGGTQ